jgi:hypothetical protein
MPPLSQSSVRCCCRVPTVPRPNEAMTRLFGRVREQGVARAAV